MLGITEVRGRKYFPACGLNTNDNEIEAKFSVQLVKWQVCHWKTLKNNHQI